MLWKGKDGIEVKMGKEVRKVSFAEYVAMQGGMVLFTSEFERYLKEKLGKKANFMKMFKAWWAEHKCKEEASEEEFTKLLLSFLFERGSNFDVRPVSNWLYPKQRVYSRFPSERRRNGLEDYGAGAGI